MPALDRPWQPASAVAGDVSGLATAVASRGRVGLAVDPRVSESGQLDAMRLAAVVGKLAPDTAIHPIDATTGVALGGVLLEDPPLEPTVDDATGRVRWQLAEALKVDPEHLRRWADQGDPAVLLVGPVGVDAPTWRRLATGRVGDCEALSAAMLDGQRDSLAELEPFLDYADAVLAAVYLDELSRAVPELQAALAEFEPADDPKAKIRADFDDDGDWRRHQCGRQVQTYLAPFASCVDAASTQTPWERAGGEAGPNTGLIAPCPMAPRLYLNGAARIGSAEPGVYIDPACHDRLGRDYVEALRAPARTAADLASDHLDPRWMILVERLATLTEVYGAVEELCTPSRRRFASRDVEAMASTVSQLGELYRRTEQPAHDARFLANDAQFRVPGVGVVFQLARYDAGTGSAARGLNAGARELRSLGKRASRCAPRPGAPPVMTLLVDTATGAMDFLGYYYAEELWCDDLGPLL